jgi:3D (Asp-Asp-Asp) domain-containing protein
VLVLAAASATAGASPGSREHDLRMQTSALDAKVRGAVLNLYAIDSRLNAAQSRLTTLLAHADALRHEQQLLAQQIASTRRTLTVSQQQLGDNLRTLYEVGVPDPIAVILGAQSFNDAVSTLDGLKHVTDQSRRFVVASAHAERRLVTLRAQLATRRARIAADVDSARRTTAELAAARTERLGFIAGLRAERALKAQQIGALEATVHQAETKAQALTAAAAASGPAGGITSGSTPPAQTLVATPAPGGRTLTVSATGYSLPGHTASGLPVGWGVVAVDPTVIPLGTRMTIPGYGEGVAADVGSGIRGAMIDLWFPTLGQAFQWGRRTVTITLH